MESKKEDWHIHSIYSGDAITSPSRIVLAAIKKGLNLICITDHDTIRGGVEAQKYVRDKNIEVVVGAEIETDKGEITGLWLREEIKSRKIDEVIKEIKAQGGKVLIPHPCGSIRWSKRKYRLEEVAPYADYIEIYNGRSFLNFKKKRIEKLSRKYNLETVSGSDAHFAFEIGNVKWVQIYKGIIGFFITGILNFILLNKILRKRWRS